MRAQLEEERRVLAAFVSRFDSLTSSGMAVGSSLPRPAGPVASFQRQKRSSHSLGTITETNSPLKMEISASATEPSLLEEQLQWDGSMIDDESFEIVDKSPVKLRRAQSPAKDVFGRKENLPV